MDGVEMDTRAHLLVHTTEHAGLSQMCHGGLPVSPVSGSHTDCSKPGKVLELPEVAEVLVCVPPGLQAGVQSPHTAVHRAPQEHAWLSPW